MAVPKKRLTFAASKLKNMEKQKHEVAALTFKKGEERATVVTTGKLWIVYIDGQTRRIHLSQACAIAHLEATGYTICMDEW